MNLIVGPCIINHLFVVKNHFKLQLHTVDHKIFEMVPLRLVIAWKQTPVQKHMHAAVLCAEGDLRENRDLLS